MDVWKLGPGMPLPYYYHHSSGARARYQERLLVDASVFKTGARSQRRIKESHLLLGVDDSLATGPTHIFKTVETLLLK